MKRLQCELCYSTDIVKIDNDLFQCQACGCKYTSEQAKSLISGPLETTIGDAEFNRLVANAETQIKLYKEEAFSTIDLIMKEYPNRHQGYWLFIKCTFAFIMHTKRLDLPFISYKSKYNGLIYDVSLESCKKAYMDLLKIADESTEIRKEDVKQFWESNIQNIVKCIKADEISGLIETRRCSDYESVPLLKALREEGKRNEKLLIQHQICMHLLTEKECEWYTNFGEPAYTENLRQPFFVLNKRITFYDDGLFYRSISDNRSFYPIKENIKDIERIAHDNAARVAFNENRCPKCFNPIKIVFGKFKCLNCWLSSSKL